MNPSLLQWAVKHGGELEEQEMFQAGGSQIEKHTWLWQSVGQNEGSGKITSLLKGFVM